MNSLHRVLLILALCCTSCTLGVSTPTPDLDATLEVRLQQTEDARPTHTPPPTETPLPTHTSSPVPSPTEVPTQTPTSTPRPFTQSVDESGWKHFTYHQENFQISLPPSWVSINLTADNLNEVIQSTAEENPEITQWFTSEVLQALISSGVKFLAIDVSQDSLISGRPANLNLFILPYPLNENLESYLVLVQSQLRGMFGEDLEIATSQTTLSGQAAGVVVYTTEFNTGSETQQMTFRQYVLLKDDTQVLITFTAHAEEYQKQLPIFQEIADSFQYQP